MQLRNIALSILVLFCLYYQPVLAQDSTVYSKLYNFPDKLFTRINSVSQKIEDKLDRQTAKYLARLERKEIQMRKKLWSKDSAAAKKIFGDVSSRYASLKNKAVTQTVYTRHLDSIQTAMKFLQKTNN